MAADCAYDGDAEADGSAFLLASGQIVMGYHLRGRRLAVFAGRPFSQEQGRLGGVVACSRNWSVR